jgi:hypothetical protein
MQVAGQLDGPAAAGLVGAARDAFVSGSSIAFAVGAAVGVLMAVLIVRSYPDDVVEVRRAEPVAA